MRWSMLHRWNGLAFAFGKAAVRSRYAISVGVFDRVERSGGSKACDIAARVTQFERAIPKLGERGRVTRHRKVFAWTAHIGFVAALGSATARSNLDKAVGVFRQMLV